MQIEKVEEVLIEEVKEGLHIEEMEAKKVQRERSCRD